MTLYIGNAETISKNLMDNNKKEDTLLFIPTVWTFEDFTSEINDLSEEVAEYFDGLDLEEQKEIVMGIMKDISDNHDSSIGVNWDVISEFSRIYLDTVMGQ